MKIGDEVYIIDEPKTEPQVRSNLEPLGVDEPRTVPLYPMTKGERVDGNQSTRIEDNKGLC